MDKEQKRIEQEVRQGLAGAAVDGKYFENLLSRGTVLGSDVLGTFVLLLGEDPARYSRAEQAALLEDRGIVPAGQTGPFQGDVPLRKGVAAYMFCRCLNIRGGLMARLFGLNGRRAVSELVFLGIMRPGSADEMMSAAEFVSVFTRAAAYAHAQR